MQQKDGPQDLTDMNFQQWPKGINQAEEEKGDTDRGYSQPERPRKERVAHACRENTELTVATANREEEHERRSWRGDQPTGQSPEGNREPKKDFQQ